MKLFDAIWYNGGRGPADGNNYWRRLTIWHYVWVGALLILFAAWLDLVLTALAGGFGVDEALRRALAGEVPPLLPLAVPALVFCLWFATGRAWIAALGTGVPLMAASFLLRPELNAAAGLTAALLPPTAEETALMAGTGALCPVLLALLGRGRIHSAGVRVIGALLCLAAAAAAVWLTCRLRG